MKDIPVFTTQHGAAGLFLREIPYRQIAYITLHNTQEPALLLEECVGFCKACGAEKIIATGHVHLEAFPFETAILQLERNRVGMGETDAKVVAVASDTLPLWRKIYNEKMANVPNASYMTEHDGKELLNRGDGYFVYAGNQLVGIGKASKGTIDTVVSLIPGMGETVIKALCGVLTEDTVALTVADTNEKAMGLYTRLGFTQTKVISRWFRVL